MHNPAQAAVVQQPLAPVGNTSHLLAPGQGIKAMLAKRMAGKGRYVWGPNQVATSQLKLCVVTQSTSPPQTR